MTKQDKYLDFLKSKIEVAPELGLSLTVGDLEFKDGTCLKPHQRDAINWAIKGGRRALFESFGLGKTIQQLLICRTITGFVGGRALIVAPLGVRQEFKRDAENKLGMSLSYIRNMAEVNATMDDILITNYERVRDGDIDPTLFTVCCLDEASVLRSDNSKTHHTFIQKFKGVRFKYVATATPSPNEYIELIFYAAFLEIMDKGQCKTRFFKRDSTKADSLTIYPHKQQEFWFWLSSWALFITKPSDLGYDDDGYTLPEMEVIYHELPVDHSTADAGKDGQKTMFRSAALGLKQASKEKRDSISGRVDVVRDLLINNILLNADTKLHLKESVSEGILQKEQGNFINKAEIEKQEKLPDQERIPSEKKPALGKEQQNENVGTTEKSQNETRSEGVSKESLSGKQDEKSSPNKEKQIETSLRNNPRALQSNAYKSRGEMSDLPENSERIIPKQERRFGYRSLSQNKQSKGTAVSSLQCGTWTISGQYRAAIEGYSVSIQTIIWVDLNKEQETIEKMLDKNGISYVSLTGSEDIEVRDVKIEKWKNKDVSVFLAKPVMYGCGINMQQAHSMIFTGISYKFQDFVQAVHRIYRFLQQSKVEIHIIYAESEREILRTLQEKWSQHNKLVEEMTEIIREHGLSSTSIEEKLMRSFGCKREMVEGSEFKAILNDSTLETMDMPDNSVDLIHTSLPFSIQYEYTPSYNDFGHNINNEAFFKQMDFLIPELHRVLKPGRIAAIHVKDRIEFGNFTGNGFPTVYRFSDKTADAFEKHGFKFCGRITVVTDVVRENNQTYRLGWTEMTKDGTKMSVGLSEYVLLFRKTPTDTSNAYADTPVVKTKKEYSRAKWQIDAHAFWRSSGDRFLSPEEIKSLDPDKLQHYFKLYSLSARYDYANHVQIAEQLEEAGKLPSGWMMVAPESLSEMVWTDVTRIKTLNTSQSQGRKTMHLCPLQFDVVDRIINWFTNKGEVVYDPFGGIMTVPYRAVKLGRKGIACELNPEYFRDGAGYLRAAEMDVNAPTLFEVEAIA